jgi:hypothetical protein
VGQVCDAAGALACALSWLASACVGLRRLASACDSFCCVAWDCDAAMVLACVLSWLASACVGLRSILLCYVVLHGIVMPQVRRPAKARMRARTRAYAP